MKDLKYFDRLRRGVCPAAVLTLIVFAGCGQESSGPQPLTVGSALHLEDHLEGATVEGAEIPRDAPESIEWNFAEGDQGWQALVHFNPEIPALDFEQLDDALQVSLSDRHRDPRNEERLHGDFYVELPDLNRSDWGHLLVRARAAGKIRRLAIAFNLRKEAEAEEDQGPFQFFGDGLPVINDGTVRLWETATGSTESPWACRALR